MTKLTFLAVALLLLIPALSVAASPELRWYRGNTHAHTINSDGDSSPDAVARWYKEHGYQFVFITDHEYITDPAPLNALLGAAERFLVLPGQEITQWSADSTHDAAHVNNLFATKVVWPLGARKCMGKGCGATADASVPLSETFKANIGAIVASRGLPQINHPNYHWSVKPEDLYDVPDGCLIEVWNGIGAINNLGGTDENGDSRPSSEGYWDILLSRGKVVWAVGSDDSHEYGPGARESAPGQAWIMVRAPELTAAAIEAGLRRGDFYASTGVTVGDIDASTTRFAITIVTKPNGPRYLTRFIGKNGTVLAEMPGTKPVYSLKGNEGYVRASITDSNGRRAWLQPVFTDGRMKRVEVEAQATE